MQERRELRSNLHDVLRRDFDFAISLKTGRPWDVEDVWQRLEIQTVDDLIRRCDLQLHEEKLRTCALSTIAVQHT